MSTEIIHNDFPVLEGKTSNYYVHRKTALRWIQQLSGKTWTDYNVHDPGVTILEVLCYVLTEIEYKMEFPIEDILHSSEIPQPFQLKNNALYLAEDIMTCAPVTTTDYRKLLIDGIKEINNAWLVPIDKEASKYEVLLLVKPHVEIPVAVNAAKELLKSYRPFGEDQMEVKGASFVYVSLMADIHLETDVDPEEVLAKVFFDLNESYLDVSPNRQTLSELETQGNGYDVIYDGPRMRNGIVLGSDLTDMYKTINTVDIKRIMASVPGVKMIDELSIQEKYVLNEGVRPDERETSQNYANMTKSKQSFTVAKGFVPFFSPKNEFIANKIRVRKNGENIVINPSKVQEIILNIFRRTTRSYVLKDHREISYKPVAKKRNILDYYSIKHDFPGAYGLIEKGYSFIQNLETKNARQLKDYLLPFEQLIANALKQLSNLWGFFSIIPIQNDLLHSPLTWESEESIGDLTSIESYDNSPSEILVKASDQNPIKQLKKRNQILTHLLARFDVHLGDRFIIKSDQSNKYKEAIRSKEKFLQDINVLLANRNVFDIDNNEGNSSLEREILLYLGIDEPAKRPYFEAVKDLNKLLKKVKVKDDRHLTKRNILVSKILGLGQDKTAYTIQGPDADDKYDITIKIESENFDLSIGKKKTKEEALRYIPKFVETFSRISDNSEGFYTLDHAMLVDHEEKIIHSPFSISFVFPNWTARFQNGFYQQEVERLIAKLVPAHIYAECFWFGLKKMKRFEKAYQDLVNEDEGARNEAKKDIRNFINIMS